MGAVGGEQVHMYMHGQIARVGTVRINTANACLTGDLEAGQVFFTSTFWDPRKEQPALHRETSQLIIDTFAISKEGTKQIPKKKKKSRKKCATLA